MTNQEDSIFRIFQVLDNEHILQDIIIIGSWSTYFYKEIYNDFDPLIRTTDIDFYVPTPSKIKEEKSVINSLKEINFDYFSDLLTNKTKFISSEGLVIEFLTRLNRDNFACVKLGNTGIYAESLSYLDIFSTNYISINFHGLMINIPTPCSYVLQKLLINSSRKEKKEKDIESIKYVLSFIYKNPSQFVELKNLFNSLPKKWKAKTTKTMEENDISF